MSRLGFRWVWAGALAGCMAAPEYQTCGELPPGTVGCEAPGGTGPDGGVGPADAGPDAAAPECDPGEQDTRPCGLNGAGTEARMCGSGQWGEWSRCDDSDICANGATEACPGREDAGDCEPGTRTCQAGQWLDCVGTVGPSAEVCDGADNDCDGQTDEGVFVGAACDGVGACGAGTRECAGPNQTRCSADPGGSRSQVAAEVCDGADNDCDGQTDEGCVRCDGDGVDVAYAGGDLPPDIAGHYTEAFDCTPEEGGAFFGGVDPAHCFRKDDRSPWRIWNTGCGWEFGLTVPSDFDPARIEWVRHARTYSGQCDAIPPAQLGTDALTTSTFYDGFGEPILGLESAYFGG